MVVGYDITRDWRYVPARETIVFHRRTAEGTFENGEEVEECKRAPLSKEMSAGDATLLQLGITWWIWKDQLLAAGIQAEPKFADKIEDGDGVFYEIRAVNVLALRSRFQCMCLRQVSGN
jgi:hypothetical protein